MPADPLRRALGVRRTSAFDADTMPLPLAPLHPPDHAEKAPSDRLRSRLIAAISRLDRRASFYSFQQANGRSRIVKREKVIGNLALKYSPLRNTALTNRIQSQSPNPIVSSLYQQDDAAGLDCGSRM